MICSRAHGTFLSIKCVFSRFRIRWQYKSVAGKIFDCTSLHMSRNFDVNIVLDRLRSYARFLCRMVYFVDGASLW
jgi:hypothetical protein